MADALLIVDMVNDFVTGVLKCERAQRIIPGIRRLADAARKAGEALEGYARKGIEDARRRLQSSGGRGRPRGRPDRDRR